MVQTHYKIILLFGISFLLLFFCLPVWAQDAIKLTEVRIQGNMRVEEEGIRLHLQARAGEPFDPQIVEKDVKSIYRMGFFDDVKAELSPEGVLTYSVKEKPYVREVKIQGNFQVGRERLETALGIGVRTILDRDKVSEGVERVKKLYREQGYVNARVDYAISVVENNQAVVLLSVEEGSRLLIKRISFQGNRAFPESELEGVMATKEEWFLSFITNRGVLDHDVLTNDLALLSSHYYDNGYINHRIAEPVILRARQGIEIVIRIEEGEQYRVGRVEVGGELIEEAQSLLKKVKLTTGQIFRGSRLRDDISNLSNLYADKGFAFAQVEPLTKINPEQKNVDIALVITRGPPVYFNRVLVAGNSKTRDKVVRREVLPAEQELFSTSKIKQSRNALQRTGYFEDVQLTTKKTDQPDTVDLLVDIKEGPTGSFNVGAGYSTGDSFIFAGGISEKNLFGRGQAVNFGAALGSRRQDFVLSFTEPYLFDTPLTLGVDAFNTMQEYTDFTSGRTGFGVRTSYPLKRLDLPFLRFSTAGTDERGSDIVHHPLIEHTRAGMAYEFTREKIGNVDECAPEKRGSMCDSKGLSWTSSLTPNLSYDSRDHFFNATEGTRSDLSAKFAGLGGDSTFIKSDLRARWHYSFLRDPSWGGTYTLALGGTLGYGIGLGGSSGLPLFERYFAGGINSVRGFKERSLGPKGKICNTTLAPSGDLDPGECKASDDVIGGDKLAVLNAEILFPIMEQYGLRGVAFFDMGQAFDSFNFADFRRSVGVGARWLSPFGPLRVELGFPLNKKSGDDTSVLGFALGGQP
jgi:outer membrane protein insertion porin family